VGIPLLFTPAPQTITPSSIPSAEAFGGARVTGASAGHPRRLATDADYQRVLVLLMVGLAVFDIVSQATEDVETAAIWGTAAALMTALAMREQVFSRIVAWLSDLLEPPRE
jgi:hypothetical protein